MVKLVQIKFDYTSGKYKLDEFAVNPEHVVSVQKEDKISLDLRVYEAKRPLDLDPRVGTSLLSLANGQKIVAIGTPEIILEKLSLSSKKRSLLKG